MIKDKSFYKKQVRQLSIILIASILFFSTIFFAAGKQITNNDCYNEAVKDINQKLYERQEQKNTGYPFPELRINITNITGENNE